MERLPAGPIAVRDAAADSIDVADVARAVRRQWRALALCLGLGIVAAIGVILFAPRRFDGKVTVFAGPTGGSGTSIAGRMSGVGELLGSLGGIGMMGSMETELQVLKSRALGALVVDSLELQFVVSHPSRLPPTRFVASSDLHASFDPRTYEFARRPDGT